ncbi:MAG: flagellar hook-length control protein FliK [Planctomycetota bacterium]
MNATGQQKSPIGRTAGFMAAAAEPAPRTRISAPPRAAAAGDPAATEAERNPDANTERILRLVHTRIGQERSVATLRLDPPELGTVRLHIDLRGEQLGLLIETQTPAARRVLEDELETLRRGLAASGIQLERVALRTAPPEQAVPDTRGQNLPSGDHGGQTGSDWHPADRSTPAQPEAGVANDTSSVPVSMTAGAPGSAAESLVDILA